MLLRLAVRNLWRNRRRTVLTLSAMVVSSSLLILALGIFSGMFEDMLASATGQYYGHLVVSATGYQDDRDMFKNFAPDAIGPALAQGEEVRGSSPRLRAFGLLSYRQSTVPVEVLGIFPEREEEVTHLSRRLTAGRYLTDADLAGALIGGGLAEKLGVVPGDELVFLTQAADGSIGNDLLRVTGIFRTDDRGRDNSLVLVPLAWLQTVTVLPGRVHEVAMTVAAPMEAAGIAARLAATLPATLEIDDWGQLLPEMREVIASYDVSRLILVTILYAATGLGILNTCFMSVMERTREFGILMALGMKPWAIRAMVLLETLAMGIFSLIIGVAAGLAMTLYMQQVGIDLSAHITPITYAGGTILPRLHAVLDWNNLLIPAVLLLLVSLAAGYLPARRAARLTPVVAIRED